MAQIAPLNVSSFKDEIGRLRKKCKIDADEITNGILRCERIAAIAIARNRFPDFYTKDMTRVLRQLREAKSIVESWRTLIEEELDDMADSLQDYNELKRKYTLLVGLTFEGLDVLALIRRQKQITNMGNRLIKVYNVITKKVEDVSRYYEDMVNNGDLHYYEVTKRKNKEVSIHKVYRYSKKIPEIFDFTTLLSSQQSPIERVVTDHIAMLKRAFAPPALTTTNDLTTILHNLAGNAPNAANAMEIGEPRINPDFVTNVEAFSSPRNYEEEIMDMRNHTMYTNSNLFKILQLRRLIEESPQLEQVDKERLITMISLYNTTNEPTAFLNNLETEAGNVNVNSIEAFRTKINKILYYLSPQDSEHFSARINAIINIAEARSFALPQHVHVD